MSNDDFKDKWKDVIGKQIPPITKERKERDRELKRQLGYSRIGRNNV